MHAFLLFSPMYYHSKSSRVSPYTPRVLLYELPLVLQHAQSLDLSQISKPPHSTRLAVRRNDAQMALGPALVNMTHALQVFNVGSHEDLRVMPSSINLLILTDLLDKKVLRHPVAQERHEEAMLDDVPRVKHSSETEVLELGQVRVEPIQPVLVDEV
ncbi:hypothetical protein K402DRAFT_12543 [Aulographum hederae CBS 113979]|uniref:Uncharacterized protein n=1 Tax=Aulographum hederae CBS 113979 TaxID=1176131 RepID=A0A6G1H728_9PEZI|nr:hypothetical protein K402DRAFT_12543 [Aulographum hederae CBS 113979]